MNANIQNGRSNFTGPPKVHNVTFGINKVLANMIKQVISWNAVQLQNDVTNYLIKHDISTKMTPGLSILSYTNTYILELSVPTSNTTLTVWVAAKSRNTPDDHGDFSDPQSITYTSTFGDHF